jgi:predicted lipid-binding transport protein (Tim44 family)
MPADILLYGLIAAGLVFWLKSILGNRSDDDVERPSKFSFDENTAEFSKDSDGKKKSNVVNLSELAGASFILPRNVRIDNKTTENTLQDLSEEDKNFNLTHFAQNLENAFEIIIEAFADGDLETLEMLLAPSVFEAFKGEIDARAKRGETVETEVKSVEKIDITEVAIDEGYVSLTVRFTAREICVIKDKSGDIISGAPDKITEMVDVWVFGKELESKTPEWHVIETRDDEIEDHKTPIPEAGDKKK